MATIDVFNLKREKVGTVDLADEVFAAEVKEHLFYEVVKAQLASRASGHRGGEEPLGGLRLDEEALQAEGHRQRAPRLIRAPIYVGGGQAHPPRPRDWSLPSAAPGAHRRAPQRALEVRRRKAASSSSTASSSPRSRPRALLTALAHAQDGQEDARRRRGGEREPPPLDPQLRGSPVPARPRASTSTTSSATTRSSSPRTPRRRSRRAASRKADEKKAG